MHQFSIQDTWKIPLTRRGYPVPTPMRDWNLPCWSRILGSWFCPNWSQDRMEALHSALFSYVNFIGRDLLIRVNFCATWTLIIFNNSYYLIIRYCSQRTEVRGEPWCPCQWPPILSHEDGHRQAKARHSVVTVLKCVVTEVVLFSIVAFMTLTFHNVM